MAISWIDHAVPETPEERIARTFAGIEVQITSQQSAHYNCAAWAVGDTEHVWDDQYGFWPFSDLRGPGVENLIKCYERLGFVPCGLDERLEPGFEKIAVFGRNAEWTHACKQVSECRWWSKHNLFEDIQHGLKDIEAVYGTLVLILKRPHSEEQA
jgi:hypothetical protein